LIGHGAAANIRLPEWTLPNAGGIFRQYLSQAGLFQPYIVAHSLGGLIALMGASLGASASIQGLTLIDIGPELSGIPVSVSDLLEGLASASAFASSPEALLASVRKPNDAPLTVFERDLLRQHIVPHPGRVDEVQWALKRAELLTLFSDLGQRKEQLYRVLGELGPKVQVLRGGRGSFISEGESHRIRQAGVPVYLIEGGTHLVHVEKPSHVVGHILEHMERLGAVS
jgi:pimeloyl-ACP methyl ester carboxylesterase